MMTETPTPRTQQHWAEAVAECITDEQEALRLIGIYEDDEWQRVMLDIGRTLLVIRRELTAEREARERAEKERAAIGDQYRAFAALDRGDVWYWQGDGSDHPESLASGCRVVMTGAQVRELTAERAARERAEAERDALRARVAELEAIAAMLGAVVQGAQEEFVRVPYGASHEDVAQINEWHKMAQEARAALAALERGDDRPCTCHPDDEPPQPCPKKYALSECRLAAAIRAAKEGS